MSLFSARGLIYAQIFLVQQGTGLLMSDSWNMERFGLKL